MKPKQILGLILTILSLILILYGIVIGYTKGQIGVKGQIDLDAQLVTIGWILILLGPAILFGETPIAIKKFVEAKTGRKIE